MRTRISPVTAITFCLCAPFMTLSLTALAEGSTDSDSPQQISSAGAQANAPNLQEIIVTARRREENLQQVPIAITVFSQQALKDNNVQTIGGLQYLVPSMSMNASVLTRDAFNVSIRGQGAGTLSSQPGVVAYLNDVPIPAADSQGDLAGGPGLLFDMANVQVLKGPQGTNFGRNAVGGAILLETARPTNDLGGHLEVGYGNYNDREIDGAINLPIVNDVFLARIAISGQLRDGFTHLLSEPSHLEGIDTDNRDYWAARGTLTLRPGDRFQNDTIFTYSKYDSNGSPEILLAFNPASLAAKKFPTLPSLFARQQALGPRTVLPGDVNEVSSGTYLSLNNISRLSIADELRFKNILGFDRVETLMSDNTDGTLLPEYEAESLPFDWIVRQYTEEAQLLGNGFANRLDWLAGVFYLDQAPPSFASLTATEFGKVIPTQTTTGNRSRAFYGQGTYDFSAFLSRLKATLGGRYTWDDIYSATAPLPLASPVTAQRAKSSAFTYNVDLDYQVDSTTLLYATTRRGYRPGGANLPSPSGNAVPDYGPEYVTDYELGVKSDWHLAQIPIRTNADIYYQNYNNIQVQQQVIQSNGIPYNPVTNAAGARIVGAEFEALAHLTQDLQLGATYDVLSFQYTDFGSGVTSPAALVAQRFLNRPPSKYGVNALYTLPVGKELGQFSWRANWNWQARSGDYSQPFGVVSAFGLLNMSVDWKGMYGTGFDASLFASNLTDKVYLAGIRTVYDTALGFAVGRYGEPRMYGIRLRYNFGTSSNH
jgi:iron complex outermembrane receptor protein